jgi:hypothetical protein
MLKFAREKNRVFHNPTLGLISLTSDHVNWITIADKNLWATVVYNHGDTKDETNCGNFYQWGNNYWFPFVGTSNTSQTPADASAYGPWNYYSDSLFIAKPILQYWTWPTPYQVWDSSDNKDLWWGETWTLAAMQWPCPSWFHIPTATELNSLLSIRNTVWFYSFEQTLKMPIAWLLDQWAPSNTTKWYYTSCNAATYFDWDYVVDYYACGLLRFTENTAWVAFGGSDSPDRARWLSLRPFANTPTVPDSSRTALY